MASGRSGSVGREGVQKKPPIPSFNTKPRAKSDASKAEGAKSKENGTEPKHEKGEKLSEDSNSDPGTSTHSNKGETDADVRRMNSHATAKDGNKTENAHNKPKGDTDKPEAPKGDAKKPKTREIPSRYMKPPSATTPRAATPAISKTAPKPTTLRSKTPERSTHTTTTTLSATTTATTRAKTPTKQPVTPRTTTNNTTTTTSTTSTTSRAGSSLAPKRTTPTPTTPTRGNGRKTPVQTQTRITTGRDKHPEPPLSPRSAAMHTQDVVTTFNIKIAGLQAQIKQLALERDSVLFQQTSEGSEQSDWDVSSVSVDGASENSSEQGDERDEKYIEIVRRYRSTLGVLSQKIVILKTALTDAKSEYDTLQAQHKQLLIAHQQSLSDLDKVNRSSDVASIS